MKINPKVLLLGLVALGLSRQRKGQAQPAAPLNIPKGGAHLSLEELRALAEQTGFPDPALAAAVAMAESQGFPMAVGDNGTSFGLWQIHVPAHREYKGKEQQLFDPMFNAAAALAISNKGQTWKWWTTYRNGDYKKYMPPAIASAVAPPAQLEPIITSKPPSPSPAPATADQEDEPEAAIEAQAEPVDEEPAPPKGERLRVTPEPDVIDVPGEPVVDEPAAKPTLRPGRPTARRG